MTKSNYILHLPSWYPNKYKPFEVSYLRDQISLLSTIKKGVVACVIENEQVDKTFDTVDHFSHYSEYRRYIPLRKGILRQVRFYIAYIQLVRSIIHDHGTPYLMHVHLLFRASLIAYFFSFKKIRYICTEQHNIFLPQDKSRNKKRILLYNKIFSSRSTHNIAISTALKEEMVNQGIKNVSTINNPVNTEIFTFKNIAKSAVKGFIHVSHLDDKHKNPILLIDAFNAVAKMGLPFKLTIVSSNEENKKKLHNYVQKLQLSDYVTMYSAMDHTELVKEYNKNDCIVMTSNYETFCIVLAEAICCGLYAISTDCGGPKDIVKNGVGVLVPLQDVDALVEAITSFIQEDHNDPRKISMYGNKFSHTNYISNYSKIYG